MTIFNDAFGNYYIGSKFGTTPINWAEILTCIRQALGSNDRANGSFFDGSFFFRIDWRPNIAQETLAGTITTPGFNSWPNAVNPNTTRFIFQIGDGVSNGPFNTSVIIHENLSRVYGSTAVMNPSTTQIICWMVANNSSFSIFIFKNALNYYFFSNGVLSNSDFAFPLNSYCFYTGRASEGFSNSLLQNQCSAGTLVDNLLVATTGAIANYAHTKTNGTATQSEVELYLRRPTLNTVPLGYIPNVFKWKVDGTEPVPQLGDIVSLNMANATSAYKNHGVIHCVVVGRLGNTNALDLTGDYILMRVAN
jgi:hypothetical protein